ncbi:helix-turn-helix domain-containing protein [Peterkaempfera griseoplana]|uniref:hypothetical protein n=1 Tax=Peterkaempfera griseoplana TaxID=66896 RepID=UPI0012FF1499|nr:hypothetical protein [Peterkaempfera griseoplana]
MHIIKIGEGSRYHQPWERPHINPGSDMDEAPYAEFASWLRELAAAAGYDTQARGGTSALAKAAGVDRGQLSRALSGAVQPSIDTQRGLVRALNAGGVKVDMPEMLVRSQTVKPEDLPTPQDSIPPAVEDIDLYALARAFDIPPERAHLFVRSVESQAKVFADDQNSTSIGDPQTGGLSAER